MNYTREPIIETVITPKEGSKLVLRNSKKQSEQEDFFVDSVEIVSFGSSLFFRSIERPKPFLLPVTDYEVLELRETKMVLKSASLETPSIKIAGGKETRQMASPRFDGQAQSSDQTQQQGSDRKGKRRSRRRRMSQQPQVNALQENGSKQTQPPSGEEVPKVSVPVIPTLLTPPPTILIKEKLSRYKAAQEERQEEREPKSAPSEEPRNHPVQEETNPS